MASSITPIYVHGIQCQGSFLGSLVACLAGKIRGNLTAFQVRSCTRASGPWNGIFSGNTEQGIFPIFFTVVVLLPLTHDGISDFMRLIKERTAYALFQKFLLEHNRLD
jgi:hypothetical protein